MNGKKLAKAVECAAESAIDQAIKNEEVVAGSAVVLFTIDEARNTIVRVHCVSPKSMPEEDRAMYHKKMLAALKESLVEEGV